MPRYSLPFADSGRLLTLTEIAKVKELSGWTSPRDYLDWKEQNHVFEDMAAWSSQGANLTGGGEPERVPGMQATASFFAANGNTVHLSILTHVAYSVGPVAEAPRARTRK